MLRLSKFSLSNNFARITYDFYKDKLIRTTKSLTVDVEDELKYEDIRVITYSKILSIDWLWRVFYLGTAIYLLNTLLQFLEIDNTTIFEIEKVLILVGLITGIGSLRKKMYWSFLDEDRDYLVTFVDSKKNHKILSEAIQLIKQKANLFSEMHPDTVLPDTPPKIEIVQYDIPDFLNKSIVMVYEDKIIHSEISLLDERVSEIYFHELSGKTKMIMSGNKNWGKYWCMGLYAMITVEVVLQLFFQSGLSLYIFITGAVLPIVLSLLSYIKQEYLLLYNKNDSMIFWVQRNKRDREKVDQIMELVQQRVSTVKGELV